MSTYYYERTFFQRYFTIQSIILVMFVVLLEFDDSYFAISSRKGQLFCELTEFGFSRLCNLGVFFFAQGVSRLQIEARVYPTQCYLRNRK